MKPHRRNWMIGVGVALSGIVVYLLNSPGTAKTVAFYAIGAGLILAGWSGSVWMEKEKPI
jgi:uncharacterized membrane protein HdeD (DUF308 family)